MFKDGKFLSSDGVLDLGESMYDIAAIAYSTNHRDCDILGVGGVYKALGIWIPGSRSRVKEKR